MKGCTVKRAELDRMSSDDLWSLHVEVTQLLQQRIQQEKLRLEERLERLQTPAMSRRVASERRPYPPVSPKYCNPDQPSETWSGRGKQPRWLVAQLRSGRRVEDFRIQVRNNKRQISDRRVSVISSTANSDAGDRFKDFWR
jgi:DNA-binding protein H-NS